MPSAGTLPAPDHADDASWIRTERPTQLERFEGMRMQAASLTSVAPTNEFGETTTVITGVARPMREPGIERPQRGASGSDVGHTRLLHPALR